MTTHRETVRGKSAHDENNAPQTIASILIGYVPFVAAVLPSPSAVTPIFILLGWVTMLTTRRREGVLIATLATVLALLSIAVLEVPRVITIS